MSKPHLIIFDCDGTLVDSEPISNRIISEMMNDLGIPITPLESVRRFAGKSFKDINAFLVSQLGTKAPHDFELQYRKKSKIAFEAELEANPGVKDFISKLTIPFCVASNGPREKMEVTLAATGLDQFFNEKNIFSAYDIEKWKPDPELFEYAASTMGYPAAHCLVFEDTFSGIEAALSAGMDLIIYDHEKKFDTKDYPEAKIISDFRQLDPAKLFD